MSMGEFSDGNPEQCVVGLTWTLKDTLGEVLDELDEPVEFLVGGDDLLAKIEEALRATSRAPASTCSSNLNTPSATTTTSCCSWSRAPFPGRPEEGMTFEGLPAGVKPGCPRMRSTP